MRNGYPGMHYSNNGFMTIPSILCAIFFTILFTILIICLIIMIVRHRKIHGHTFSERTFGLNNATTKALEILNIRYANSEITDEEYNAKKEQLLKK